MGTTSDLASFMSRVLPWPAEGEPGYINLHWTLPDHPGMGGRPFVHLAAMLADAAWGATRPHRRKDIYFCLSRQSDVGMFSGNRRKAVRNVVNATHLKAIWLDVDANKEEPKGYPTKEAAIAALMKFLADSKLPPPSAIVDSGNGFHVYWISDKPLTQTEWRPYAQGLWALVQKHGLHADPLTTDAARILRVPDTYNRKAATPKLVKLKQLGVDYAFESTLGWVKGLQGPSPVQGSAGTQSHTRQISVMLNSALFPKRAPITDDVLAADCQRPPTLPIDAHSVIVECPHYMDAIKTGGKDHNQGLWMQTILGSTWFKNGRAVAHALSNKHPGYTAAATDAMFDRKMADREERGLGWPSCKTFENYGCTKCALCPYKGKIRSPLNLGKPFSPAVFAAPPPPPPADTPPLHLPKKYGLNNEGYIGYIKQVSLAGGAMGSEFARLFMCRLTFPWAEREPIEGLHFICSKSKGHSGEVFVPQSKMASTQTLSQSLHDQGVKIDHDNKEGLCSFMTSWLTELHDAKEAEAAVPFGWYDEGGVEKGFAYAGKLYKANGVTSSSAASDPQIRMLYSPHGQPLPWEKACKMITNQHRPALEVLVAATFAAPLMKFTNQYSGCIVGYGKTGAGKSSACDVGAAVWGHPKLTKEKAGTSNKSLMAKAGLLNNIVIYWDDVSKPEDLDRAVYVVGDVTTGNTDGKLFRDGSQRPRHGWQNQLVVCSNGSLFDAIVKAVKSNSADLMRIFEFNVPAVDDKTQPGQMETYEADKILGPLADNFGNIGARYAEVLARDPAAIKKMVEDKQQMYSKLMVSAKDERYWITLCATIHVGAALANGCLGCDFHLTEIREFLCATYLHMRARVAISNTMGSSYQHTTKVLSGFLKLYNYETLRVHDLPPPRQGRPKAAKAIDGPNRQNKYHIHITWVVNKKLLRLSKEQFDAYLLKQEETPAIVYDGLRQHYGLVRPYPEESLCRGTVYNGAKETLLQMPVDSGTWLETEMNNFAVLAELGDPVTHSGLPEVAPGPSATGPQQSV